MFGRTSPDCEKSGNSIPPEPALPLQLERAMTNDLPAAGPRPIRLPELFSLVLLWNSGYNGARVLNTLYALHLGAQPLEIGLLLATYGLFALVLGIYAGRVVDRYGVRVPVVGGIVL